MDQHRENYQEDEPGRHPLLRRDPVGPYFASLRELAVELRGLVDVAMSCHVPAEVLDGVKAELGALKAALEAAAAGNPGGRERSLAGMDVRFQSVELSPIRGQANPIAPPMEISLEGGVAVGRMVCGAGYQGPPGHVQGGVIAAAFDVVLGTAQALAGLSGMTASLNVTYKRPAPLDRELRFEARVAEADGRKVRTVAELTVDGATLATAEGLFIIRRTDIERGELRPGARNAGPAGEGEGSLPG